MSDKGVAVDQDQDIDDAGLELSDEEQAMAKLKKAISVTTEDLGSLRLKMTVTIPEATLDERRGEQFAELKRDSTVPGFRKGHAPLPLIQKRFASDVGEQLKSQLYSSGYLAAVEKEELKPLGDPLMWVTVKEERTDDDVTKTVEVEKLLSIDAALEHLTLPKSGPLSYSCEIELKPEIELPKLDKIPVTKPAIAISDEDVDNELTRLRSVRGTFEPVEKGKVKSDDMLYADMKMTVDGEVVVSKDNYDLPARDFTAEGVRLEGLGDAIVNKKIDDVVSAEGTVSDDHENIGIRGKKATFEFTIREIKRLEIPELDEAFLASCGVESEADLKKLMRNSLESRLDATLQDALREQIGAYLMDNTEVDIPKGVSERQAQRSVARRMIEMYQAGVAQAEIEKKVDEMKAAAHDQAIRDIKLFFILEQVAEERDIEVGEEEMNGAIAQIAQRSNKRFDRVRDELSKGDGLQVLYHQLRDQRVLDDLLKEAEITEGEGPKKKAATKTAKKPAAAKKKVAAKAAPKASVKKTPKAAAKKKSAKRS